MATTAWKHHSFAADANDGSVLSVIQADLSTSSVVDVDRVVGNTILRSFSLGKKLLARDVADAKIEIDAFVDFSNISGKPTTVAGYGITDAVSAGLIGAPDGLATLDSSGKLTAGQLPPISITDTFVVVSQAAMLALTAQTGDVAVRTDLNKSYILKGTDPLVLADWQELLSPTDAVTSVNGQTGVVDISFALLSSKPTTIVGFGITDAYTKTELQTSGSSSVHYDNVSNKPTTIVGFGITDAYTKTELQTSGQSLVHFDNVSNKPTTLVGYGITDTVITDAFVHVANSVGTSQFSAVGLDTVRFAAGADLGVTFDPATKTITFAFTGSTSGITQAAADARYLQLTGGTLSGTLTATDIAITGGAGGANKIIKHATSGLAIYGGTGSSYDLSLLSSGGSYILRVPTGTGDIIVNNVTPATTTTHALGSAAFRWSGVFSGGGDFSGNVTVGGSIAQSGGITGNGGFRLTGSSFQRTIGGVGLEGFVSSGESYLQSYNSTTTTWATLRLIGSTIRFMLDQTTTEAGRFTPTGAFLIGTTDAQGHKVRILGGTLSVEGSIYAGGRQNVDYFGFATVGSTGTINVMTWAGNNNDWSPVFVGGKTDGTVTEYARFGPGTGNLLVGTTADLATTHTNWATVRVGYHAFFAGVKATTGHNAIFGAGAYIGGAGVAVATDTSASIYQQSSGAHYWYAGTNLTAGSAVTLPLRMMIDTAGRLLVGTSSEALANSTMARFSGNTPEIRITDEGSYYASISFWAKGGGAVPTQVGNLSTYWGHSMIFTTTTGHGYSWRVNGASPYVLRIFPTGHITMSGLDNPVDAGYRLDVQGTVRVSSTLNTQGGLRTNKFTGIVATAGTPTTVLSLDSITGSGSNFGNAFLVTAADADGNSLGGYCIIVTFGNNYNIVDQGGTALTFSISGSNLQITQTSGAPRTIQGTLTWFTISN